MEDLSGDRFVTFAAAKLSPDGTLEVFSAGQGPLVIRRHGGAAEVIGSHTFPLGIAPELPHEEATVRRLAPGDTLLMTSDGLTEARNRRGEQWNTSGLLDTLNRLHGLAGSELLGAIDRENIAFADGEPPADDRTAVVATYRGG